MPARLSGNPHVALAEFSCEGWSATMGRLIEAEIKDIYAGQQAAVSVMSRTDAEAAKERRIFDDIASVDARTGLATVRISGSLFDGSIGWFAGYGIDATGYDDLAMVYQKLAADSDVKGVLLHIRSGGGQVSGLSGANTALDSLRASKPVATYASYMASAALWHGVRSDRVVADRSALVGSVGVMATHVERTQADAREGYKYTIVRAGKEKALANPHEVLSAEALAQITASAETYRKQFVSDVAQSRGMAFDKAKAAFGEGTEFIGEAALAAGLVDEIGTPITAYEGLHQATSKSRGKQQGGKTANLRAVASVNSASLFTSASPAAITAGHNSTNVIHGDQMPKDKTGQQAALDDVAILAAQAGIVAAPEAPAAEQAATSPTAALVNEEPLVSELDRLKASYEADKANWLADTAKLHDDLAKAQSTLKSMSAVLGRSIEAMCVPLNVSAGVVDATTPEAILARHAEVSALFASKFPVGGRSKRVVADLPTSSKTEQVESTATSNLEASLLASKLNFLRKN